MSPGLSGPGRIFKRRERFTSLMKILASAMVPRASITRVDVDGASSFDRTAGIVAGTICKLREHCEARELHDKCYPVSNGSQGALGAAELKT